MSWGISKLGTGIVASVAAIALSGCGNAYRCAGDASPCGRWSVQSFADQAHDQMSNDVRHALTAHEHISVADRAKNTDFTTATGVTVFTIGKESLFSRLSVTDVVTDRPTEKDAWLAAKFFEPTSLQIAYVDRLAPIYPGSHAGNTDLPDYNHSLNLCRKYGRCLISNFKFPYHSPAMSDADPKYQYHTLFVLVPFDNDEFSLCSTTAPGQRCAIVRLFCYQSDQIKDCAAPLPPFPKLPPQRYPHLGSGHAHTN